jgi:hypothetical protein
MAASFAPAALQGYAQVLQLCDESVTRPEIRSTAPVTLT